MEYNNVHIQKNCRFCDKVHVGNSKVCRDCFDRNRPRLSAFWLIFWLIIGIVPGIIYVIIKKNQQDEWDKKYL